MYIVLNYSNSCLTVDYKVKTTITQKTPTVGHPREQPLGDRKKPLVESGWVRACHLSQQVGDDKRATLWKRERNNN